MNMGCLHVHHSRIHSIQLYSIKFTFITAELIKKKKKKKKKKMEIIKNDISKGAGAGLNSTQYRNWCSIYRKFYWPS